MENQGLEERDSWKGFREVPRPSGDISDFFEIFRKISFSKFFEKSKNSIFRGDLVQVCSETEGAKILDNQEAREAAVTLGYADVSET